MKTWKIVFIVIIVSVIGFGAIPLKKNVAELKTKNQELYKTKQEKIAELKGFTGKNAEGVTNIVDPVCI